MSSKVNIQLSTLLREANAKLDEANAKLKEVNREAAHWKKENNRTNQEFLAFQFDLFCDDCRRQREGELCGDCSSKKETQHGLKRRIADLTQRVDYWEKCYESLLEEFYRKNDRRGHDGADQRL